MVFFRRVWLTISKSRGLGEERVQVALNPWYRWLTDINQLLITSINLNNNQEQNKMSKT
ncbi:unnamed protein product [Paramecium sonneborni]|uniref:Uncharacterized protein n=1 Tax=Paramecium sonneborni TaxID=65129 RepID=A0A8S1LNB7_9CILI|nr:unnamed protein product [Paramecium sonneborni]